MSTPKVIGRLLIGASVALASFALAWLGMARLFG